MISHTDTTYRRNKKGNIGLSLLALILLLGAITISFAIRQSEVIAARKKVQDLEAQIRYYQDDNLALLEQVDALKTDAYIEKVAREKLGLVMPGEMQYMMITYEKGK
jgi:cell division protein FtsL